MGRLVPPIGIALLAAVLRLWAIDLAPLRYDDVDVLSRTRAVVGGELTATGPLTSWGIPDPPLSVYLAVVPAALPRPPVSAAAWFALLNVLAVVLTYLLARRFFGPGVALAAGLLFAVNPWAVYFSRRSWAEIVPLLTVLALGSAYLVVGCRRARWAVLFFVALALQVQTRILALIFAPAALLSLVLFPRRWGLRWPLAGVALGALVSLPYAVWVLLHWEELRARLAAGNRGIALAGANHSAVELVLWMASGVGLLPLESRAAPWLDPLGQANLAVLWATGLLLLVGLLMTARAVICRRDGWERPLLAAAWLLLPVGALVAQSSSVYLHYLVALLPSPFLIAGLPLGALLERRAWPARLAGAGLLAAICAVQVGTTAALYHVLTAFDVTDPPTASVELRRAAPVIAREAANVLGTGEQYGVETPIRFWQTLADGVHAAAASAGLREAVVLAGETDPLTAERPAILDYLLRPAVVPRFVAPGTLVFPFARPGLVVEAPDVEPIESIERFGERRTSVPVPSTNRAARDLAYVTVIPSRDLRQWTATLPGRVQVPFEQGVVLLGYRVSTRTLRVGDELLVTTFWKVGPGSPVSLTALPRLVGPDGTESVAPREPAEPLPDFRQSEWVVARREVMIPPSRAPAGEYRLEVQLVNVSGRALRRADDGGDRVTLTTIQVTPR